MRLGGYIRVSHVGRRDREKFLSPTLQRQRIEGWCAVQGHELVVVREDLDVSGGKADRPNLIGLIESVERGELEGIVVAALDRFGRSLLDALTLLDRIRAAGGQFASVKDSFDTTTPTGRLTLNLMLSIAQFELERHRDQWHEARAAMIGQGRHVGPAPFGYRRDGDGVLEPDEHAELVRELFKRRASGESASVLARWLQAQGVTTPRGGQPGRRFVGDVIGSPTYLGQVRAGELVGDDAHPALVDRVTWEKANAANGPRPTRTAKPSVLTGLVRCHSCMYATGVAQSTYGHDGARRRAFRCRKHHGGGECPSPSFALEEQLVPIVEAAFFDTLGDLRARAATDTATLERLREKRDKARHALTTFRDDPDIIEALGPGDYAEGLRARRAALETAEAALAKELAGQPAGTLPDAADLRDHWPEIDVDTKRRMIAAVFGAIVVRAPRVKRSHSEPLAERVAFVAAGGLPDDTPKPGRNPVKLRAFRPAELLSV